MGLKTTSLPHGNLQSVEWSKHLNWNNIALLVLQELMVILGIVETIGGSVIVDKANVMRTEVITVEPLY